tara:strand:+ start:904 stop:1137 length:234 start_codon:yes stop_codon:yes gene_type:complete
MDDSEIDLNELINRLQGSLEPDKISRSIRSLVKNGLIEQFTNEKGDFVFELTEFGKEVAKQIDEEDGLDNFLQGGKK